MLDLLLNVLTGGGLGLLGSIVSKVLGLFEAAQKRKDRAMAFAHELKLLELQSRERSVEREHELAIAQEATWAGIRTASYEHDESYGTNGFTAWLRWVRPALTLLLIALTAVVFFSTTDFGVRAEIANAVVVMAMMALTWWFGDRQMNKLSRGQVP
ncbi:MAG: hypothetical protein J5I81_04245 [Nitrococcus mobilis]|nr:hypothetical protein [Nitrococcus mobilis]